MRPWPKIPGMVIKWNDKPNIVEISREGQMAYSIDTMRMSVPDSSGAMQTRVNQGIHVWRKESDGSWRVSLLTMYPINNARK